LSDLKNWNKTQLQYGYNVLLSTIEDIKQIILDLENRPEQDNKFIEGWKLSLSYAYRRKYEYEYHINL
jgi:hypothetical protein